MVANDLDGVVVLVSACLAGMLTRYNGTAALNEKLMQQLAGVRWIPVCPEEAGGLPTPRPPADMVGGDGYAVLRGTAKVLAADGCDVTAAFVEGAHNVLSVARRFEVKVCYLKSHSPSCGPTPSQASAGHMRGVGVCAALLMENGFKVIEL